MQLLLFLEKIIDVLDSTELVITTPYGYWCLFFFQSRKDIYIYSDNLLLLFHANKLGEEGEGRKLDAYKEVSLCCLTCI